MQFKHTLLLTAFFFLVHFLSAEENLTREKVASWVEQNYADYYQKYNLSCEAAIVRLVVSAMGITGLDEDKILSLFPVHPSDPSMGLVMQEIDGKGLNPDGTVNWGNYGAHAEVVAVVLEKIFKEHDLDSVLKVEVLSLDNNLLREAIREEDCLGAILWVAADWGKNKPPKNEKGQVYGEHVQYVIPVLDPEGRFIIYDVWPWQEQPFIIFNPLNRELFDNKVILLRKRAEENE